MSEAGCEKTRDPRLASVGVDPSASVPAGCRTPRKPRGSPSLRPAPAEAELLLRHPRAGQAVRFCEDRKGGLGIEIVSVDARPGVIGLT